MSGDPQLNGGRKAGRCPPGPLTCSVQSRIAGGGGAWRHFVEIVGT